MNDGLMFTGFPAAGLALLERLPTFDKSEFEHHRDAWENELRLPAHYLAQAVGTRLVEEVSPAPSRSRSSMPPSPPSIGTCASTRPGPATRTISSCAGGREL